MSVAKGTSHTMHALTELRQRILSGELSGGERLLEVPLTKLLNISRTPVREAMSRLVEEGLLDRAKSGFVVRVFGKQDVADAIELRGVLEGTAARLAAERGVSEKQLAMFASIVHSLDKCLKHAPFNIDFDGYSRLNAEFHTVLASLAGSQIIERELERVSKLPFASPSAFLPDKIEIAGSRHSLIIAQSQHREILAAITQRAGARAEAIAREHAQTARRDLEYVLQKSDVPLIKP